MKLKLLKNIAIVLNLEAAKFTTDVFQAASNREIQKVPQTTSYLIGNKSAHEVAKLCKEDRFTAERERLICNFRDFHNEKKRKKLVGYMCIWFYL